MKIKTRFLFASGFALLSFFLLSCSKDKKGDPFVRDYPFAMEYQELSFEPTHWNVLTMDAYTPIGEPPNRMIFDDSLKAQLLSEEVLPPFRRLEFLSDSTVMVTFIEGIIPFDTILPYLIDQGRTKILLGSQPGEAFVLHDGPDANALTLEVVSTFYSYQLPDGSIEYSPLYIQYVDGLSFDHIINDLRTQEDLMLNDTVAVNRAGYIFR